MSLTTLLLARGFHCDESPGLYGISTRNNLCQLDSARSATVRSAKTPTTPNIINTSCHCERGEGTCGAKGNLRSRRRNARSCDTEERSKRTTLRVFDPEGILIGDLFVVLK